VRLALALRCLIWAVGLVVVAVVLRSALAQELGVPTLGASPAAFEVWLGAPNDASIGAQLHYQRCAGTDVDQVVLLAPNDQVWSMQRAWCDDTPVAAADRFADAARYVPPDAVPSGSFTTELGEPAQQYVSATLATQLPASLFHDCLGNQVAPGTLVVVADALGGWDMGPGTCP
jgi:hypothetical protein